MNAQSEHAQEQGTDPHSVQQGAPVHNGGRVRAGSDMLGFDLVSLTRSAAQLRANKVAFAFHAAPGSGPAVAGLEETLTYTQFQAMVHDYAGALKLFGLKQGECLLVTGCLSPRSVAAVLAGLSIGLDTAIAGMHLDQGELAEFAGFVQASAMVTEASSHNSASSKQVLAAAALSDGVRLVISVADEAPDGTVPISAAGKNTVRLPALAASAHVITRNPQGAPVTHSQQTLIAAGLDFISQSKISAAFPVLSTILPASFAGLVCGPLTGLLTGAPVMLHAPFDSATLQAAITDNSPVQLVAPAAISQQINDAGWCNSQNLSALVLLSRHNGIPDRLAAPALPALKADNVAISDLVAFDEIAIAAQIRDDHGLPVCPLDANHTIQIDGKEVLAVRAVKHLLDTNGVRSMTIAFEGAAVSKLDWKFYDSAG